MLLNFPDVTALFSPNPSSPTQAEGRPIAVEELKTFWTFPLEIYPVTSPVMGRRSLERPIGKQIHLIAHRYMSNYAIARPACLLHESCFLEVRFLINL